jgi:hypothetical protein
MISYSPRTTSLSVARAQTQRDAAEERFFKALDGEVRTRSCVNVHTCLITHESWPSGVYTAWGSCCVSALADEQCQAAEPLPSMRQTTGVGVS